MSLITTLCSCFICRWSDDADVSHYENYEGLDLELHIVESPIWTDRSTNRSTWPFPFILGGSRVLNHVAAPSFKRIVRRTKVGG